MRRLFSGSGNPNWKPVKALRRASKRSLRGKIILRDRRCVRCGAVDRLHVHHKDSNPSNNSPDNLEALCKSCHAWAHAQAGESYLTGLISVAGNRRSADKLCLICGRAFHPSKAKQRYCGPACGAKAGGRIRSVTMDKQIARRIISYPNWPNYKIAYTVKGARASDVQRIRASLISPVLHDSSPPPNSLGGKQGVRDRAPNY
jgi:hypothetical protein